MPVIPPTKLLDCAGSAVPTFHPGRYPFAHRVQKSGNLPGELPSILPGNLPFKSPLIILQKISRILFDFSFPHANPWFMGRCIFFTAVAGGAETAICSQLPDGRSTDRTFYRRQGRVSISKTGGRRYLRPGGKYLCLYDLSAISVRQWLTDTIETMNRYAAENGLQLDGCFYAEFNDITIIKNERQQLFPRMIRSRLL